MSSVIAIVVIIALLALGGIYYAMTGGGAQTPDTMPTTQDAQNSTDPDVQAAMNQSSADDLNSIQADANATDLGGMDAAVSNVNSSSQ